MQNDIQRAIAILKQERIEYGLGPRPFPHVVRALNTAITALEQQEREPCEYCSDLGNYKGFAIEFYHQTAADETYGISLDANYCPHCGRKLVRE